MAAFSINCGDKESCSDTDKLSEALVAAKTGDLSKLKEAIVLFEGRNWKTPEGKMLGDDIAELAKYLGTMDARITTPEARDQRDYDLKQFRFHLDSTPTSIARACK